MMSSRASSSSFSFSFAYDVFLSFRGSDTRYGFTGNLHKALSDKGINTFIDDEDLQKGDEITPTLLKAIEESRIAIVVFSENYASSAFCLKELVKILECIKNKGRLVLPIFYEVDPSDLRHIKGSYGEAMAKHEARFSNDKEEVKKWKLALQEAANLSGSHFRRGHEYEHKFIGKIVKEVSRRTNRIFLFIADHPIGLESQVQRVKSLLDIEKVGEVIMVGIHGIGGVGKSTIARATYNFIADQFEGVCFLDDVRNISIQKGLVQLQETMLFKLVGEKHIKITDACEGISIIKNRLCRKKILLILDDVNELDQLKKLVGGFDWFGFGSRIIITTRNEHLLHVHGVERTYEVKTLSHEEAHELLTWNAFKGKDFDPSYLDVLNSLVLYCNGLPLALEVIGGNLYGKRLDEWKSALDAYEKVPEKSIQQVLKVSYDDLGDIEKEFFLDIACFFKGHELEYVENVLLNGHGISPQAVIGALVDRSLIKIDSRGYNYVMMHNLIEDMGKEIVRKESPLQPGKRSRLWFYQDILHVFEENTGTDNIGAIILDSKRDTQVHWRGNALKKMINLQILIIKNASFSKEPKYLPNSLRYLEWEECPLSTLPFNFKSRMLATLKLRRNRLTSFKLPSNFESLTEINLKQSKFLTQVPDISAARNLKVLILDYCSNLIEVDNSVGTLDKLCILRASNCTNLKIFPEAIKSTSLEVLNLSACSSLERMPAMQGVIEKINEVRFRYLWKTSGKVECVFSRYSSALTLSSGVSMLPTLEKTEGGFSHLKQSKVQDDCERESSTVSYVKILDIKSGNLENEYPPYLYCPAEDEYFPAWHPCFASMSLPGLEFHNLADKFVFKYLHWFPKLEELDLSGNNFTIVPECLNECQFLRILKLDYCKQLQEIRGMPPNIEHLSAINCTSLNAQSQSILRSQTLHETGTRKFVLPGTMIPEWFGYKQPSAKSFSFWVRNKFPNHIVFGAVQNAGNSHRLLVDGSFFCSIELEMKYAQKPHVYLQNLRLEQDSDENFTGDKWTHVEVSVSNAHNDHNRGVISWMGVHVYNKGENSRKDVRFTDPGPGKSKVDEDTGDINPNYSRSVRKQHDWTWEEIYISRMKAFGEVKSLMIKIGRRCLPTCEYLFSEKHVIKNPLCPICETEYETIEHVFSICPWTRAVWFGSDLQFSIYLRGMEWFTSWIRSRYHDFDFPDEIMGIMGNICWAIWKGRNEYVLEGKPVDPALALFRAKTLNEQYYYLLLRRIGSTSKRTCQEIYGYEFLSDDESWYSDSEGEERGSENKVKGKNTLIASYNNNSDMNKAHSKLLIEHKATRDSIIAESISDKEEERKDDDRVKGKSILMACNNNNNNSEAETSYPLDSMIMDSTIDNTYADEPTDLKKKRKRSRNKSRSSRMKASKKPRADKGKSTTNNQKWKRNSIHLCLSRRLLQQHKPVFKKVHKLRHNATPIAEY